MVGHDHFSLAASLDDCRQFADHAPPRDRRLRNGARHSLVTSSTMLRMRKRRPLANWSWTKSSDQRAFGLASTRIGARVPTAFAASPPFADGEPFLAIKPVDPVDARWLALPPQQDVPLLDGFAARRLQSSSRTEASRAYKR